MNGGAAEGSDGDGERDGDGVVWAKDAGAGDGEAEACVVVGGGLSMSKAHAMFVRHPKHRMVRPLWIMPERTASTL